MIDETKTKQVTYKRLNYMTNFKIQILENKHYFPVNMEHYKN